MKALETIRKWKNKVFADWQWDLLVGALLAVISLFIGINVMILPIVITVVNQFYNNLFEPRDFALRMVFPLLIFIIQMLCENL